MSIEHWMMFATFREQKHFVHPTPDTYRGAILNANMVAHAPDGLGAFLLERTKGLSYLVDPLTHAFQHDPGFLSRPDGEVRPSIRKLAQAFGEPVSSVLGTRPIEPSDFESASVSLGFAGRCLRFQLETLASAMTKNDAYKYISADGPELRPHALVAPYFYLTESSFEEWLPISVAMIEHSRQLHRDMKLYASCVLSQGALLDERVRRAIAGALAATPADGFLLWIDEFDETRSGSAELRAFLELVRQLRRGGTADVINLHGGYFSILAAGPSGHAALSGVTHGPEFGEFRAVVPVGGGIPIARYYVPQLHARIRFRDALRYFNELGWLQDAGTFHRNVCDCDECRLVLSGEPAGFLQFGEGTAKEVRRGKQLVRIDYPTPAATAHCLRHYLQRKAREFDHAESATRDTLMAELDSGFDTFKPLLGSEAVGYLKVWKSVLTS